MDAVVEVVAVEPPETYGCTVDDVLRLLPHVTVDEVPAVTPGVSNELYLGRAASGDRTGRRLTRSDVEAFIAQVATRVSARLWRLDSTPERFRENLRVMARDLVANGAAHYVQAALFPASAGPNDGSAYADRLWQRFKTDLDDMVTQVDDVIDEGIPDTPGSVGRTAWSSPAPFFSDEMRF